MKKVKIFLTLFFGFLLVFIIVDRFISPSTVVELVPKISNSSIPSVEYWSKTDHDLFKASNTFFAETLERSKFNGAILVTRGGKIIFEKYAGLIGVLNGNSIDSTTSFHLASISKTFTAMAILKLREMLLLNLDKPINNYLQGFPFNNITVRLLLNHRSGLPNYVHFVERLGWDTQKNLTNEDLLQLIIKNAGKLSVGSPDRYFDYCNTNYALLALIIEKVSNMSYSDFLKTHFFLPLGMSNSFVFRQGMQEKVLPSFKFNNRIEPFMFLDEIYGDKNVYSTARDLQKWDEALYENKMFKKETLDEAFKGYSYEKRGIRNYGLGWRLIEMPTSKKIIYHNGWWHGNNTVFCRFPNDSTSIIVLGNKFNKSIYQARKIGGIFEGYDVQWDEEN
jgi:CubicO group peptidase (beta-lactamase class C family)